MESGEIDTSKGKTQIAKTAPRHEYKTINVLQYDTPRGSGQELSGVCEALESEGWEVVSASAVGSSQHWNTTSFAVVARRPKRHDGVIDYFEYHARRASVPCGVCGLYAGAHDEKCAFVANGRVVMTRG